MFTTKPLVRKSNPRFVIKRLVKVDRATFIVRECRNGSSYAEAIRSWDSKARTNG